MQARIRSRATTVGVNGDFFTLETGESSGIFLRDSVLSSPPSLNRSALVLGLDSRIVVDIFRLTGTWQAGAFALIFGRTFSALLVPCWLSQPLCS